MWIDGIAGDAAMVPSACFTRLAERDADILGRVVIIDMEIALGLDRDVDERMAGQQVEHMIEEANAGRDVGHAGAVEIDRDLDLGLLGLALDGGLAHGTLSLAATGRNAAF